MRGRVGAVCLSGLVALLALGYFVQPIVLEANSDRVSSLAGNPALVLLRCFVALGRAAAGAGLGDCALGAAFFCPDRSSSRRRSLFSVCGEQCGEPAGAPGLSIRDRAPPGLDRSKPALEDGVSRSGGSSRGLWPPGQAVESISTCREFASCPRFAPRGGTASRSPIWLRWLALVFIPSSWLLGVTAYLTTDMASVPLAWIIPLALYLLSFILAFARSAAAFVRLATMSLPFLIVPLVLVMSAGFVHLYWIPLHLIAFFAGSLACHGALAQMRPETERLSLFYVTIALGGLLGGIWTAIAAPILFDRVVEYPLAIVLSCLAAPLTKMRDGGRSPREWLGDFLFAGVVFLLAVSFATNQAGLGDSAARAHWDWLLPRAWGFSPA